MKPSSRAFLFDIFDTLLVRRLATSGDVHQLLGEQLKGEGLVTCPPSRFRTLREVAEARATLAAYPGDPGLREIWAELLPLLELNGRDPGEYVNRELMLEESLLLPSPPGARALERARHSGKRVIFVSDTFLPARFLEKILSKHNLFLPGDGLYASCERGARKRDGSLFKLLLEKEGLPPSSLVHTGDDPVADHEAPASLGIATAPLTAARGNRYEAAVGESGGAPFPKAAMVRGAMRLARLNLPESASATAETAAMVYGPLVTGFALWCLERARAEGIGRVYFLSRDGDVTLKAAKILAPSIGFEGELRYLSVSRSTLRLAAFAAGGCQDFGELLQDTHFLSLSALASRFSLTVEELENLSGSGFPKGFSPYGNLPPAERRAVLQALKPEKLSKLLKERVAGLLERTLGYLENEGFFLPGNLALVDVGWRGSLQADLEKLGLLKGKSPTEISGLYFGLTFAPGNPPMGQAKAWAGDWREKPSENPFLARIPLVELGFASSSGRLLDYRPKEEGFAPLRAALALNPANAWGVGELHKGILGFAKQAAGLEVITSGDLLKAASIVFDLFAKTPASGEAEAFGSFPWSEDPTEAHWEEVGPKIPTPDALPLSRWPEGSLMRSNLPAASTLKKSKIEPDPTVGATAALFGAGLGGERALAAFSSLYRFKFVLDNDPGKNGTLFHDLPVKLPTGLFPLTVDAIIVASVYRKELVRQLRELGVPEDRILVADNAVTEGRLGGLNAGFRPEEWLVKP